MHLNLTRIPKSRNNIRKFPQTPGVYLFWQKNTPIYIGKAVNLRSRVLSYFSKSVFGKTRALVKSATDLSYIKVDSDLEAILLEATLVNKYQPRFNSELKDDKSPLYIQITQDEFPRVLSIRKPSKKDKSVFGPYPSSTKVKEVLKMLRRIFPYSTHKIAKKPCIESQINLCHPCPSYITGLKNKKIRVSLTKEYLDNIKMLKGILSGRFKFVRRSLEQKMLWLAKEQDFDKAAKIRDRIKQLDYVTSPNPDIGSYLKNPNFYEDIRQKEAEELKELLNQWFHLARIERVECYDISHLGGIAQAASMVTFQKGEADKAYYRHFRVRAKTKSNDTASLSEVIRRRIRHLEDWGKPDLVVVDGGKPQVAVFYQNLYPLKIPVIGLAKRLETLVIYDGHKFFEKVLPEGYVKNFLQRIRNEAHRFAKKYHEKLFSKMLTKQFS